MGHPGAAYGMGMQGSYNPLVSFGDMLGGYGGGDGHGGYHGGPLSATGGMRGFGGGAFP